MPAVGVVTEMDPVLGAVAPVVLAAAHPTALVVDRDGGVPLPGERTLADLAGDGLRLADLAPERAGVAIVPNGGVAAGDADDVIRALAERWPVVVVRGRLPGAPLIPVVPLFPGLVAGQAAVHVETGLMKAPSDGVVVPGPSRSAVQRVLAGRTVPRRLASAWAKVWGVPWRS